MVEALDLRENPLITKFPLEILKFKNLKWLNIDSKSISSIPNEIGQLKNLRKIYLHRDSLSVLEREKIKKLLPNCEIIF